MSRVQERLFFLVKTSGGSSKKRHELIEKLQDELIKEKDKISKIRHPENGNTLLHEAVALNNTYAVRMILALISEETCEYFITKNRNNEGLSALDIAEQNGSSETLTLLKSSIATDRSLQFVRRLLDRYKKKMEKCKKIVAGDPVAHNQNATGQRVTSAIGAGSRVIGVGCIGKAVISVSDSARFYLRLEQAEMIWLAHHQFYAHHSGGDLPEGLGKLLIRDGFEIFACLEEHLMNKFPLKKWRNTLDKLVGECVKRMLNYVQAQYQGEEEEMLEEGHLSKFFVKGWTSGFRSGHWQKVLDKAGVIMKDPADRIAKFVKIDGSSDVATFGYRKAFKFEIQEGFPDEEEYHQVPQALSLPYDSFLTDRMIAKSVRKLFAERKLTSELAEEEDVDYDDYESMMVQVTPVSTSAMHYNLEKHVDPFVGRKLELERLRKWFTTTVPNNNNNNADDDENCGRILTGSCGVGKTQLVRKFANELEDKEHTNIVFLDGKYPDQSFRQFYEHILAVHAGGNEGGDRDSVDGDNLMCIRLVVRFCYRYLHQRERTLVVLLNLECAENIDTYLPNSKKYGNVRVVITSKSPSEQWCNSTSGYKQEVLKAFSEKDCENLLRAVGSDKDLDVMRLANVLDYSPLALHQVREYILEFQRSQPDIPKGILAAEIVNAFIDSFYGNKGEYTSVVKAIFEKEVNGKNIIKSWSAVLESLREKEDGPTALLICDYMAYLSPNPVFLQTFMKDSVSDDTRLLNAIKLLEEYNILKEQESSGLYQMRFMTKKVIRFQNGSRGMEAEKLGSLLQHMLNFLSSGKGCQLPEDFIKHIVFAWSYAVHHDKLIESYIMNYPGYSQPSNSFLHVILKHDIYRLSEILLDKLGRVGEGKVEKSVIANSKMLADGGTLLHISVSIKDAKMRMDATKLFLQWGAKVGAQNYQDDTPLHVAAELGHTDAVEMMLRVDTSVRKRRNGNGDTAYQLAQWRRHVETARMLLNWRRQSRKEKYRIDPLGVDNDDDGDDDDVHLQESENRRI